MRIAGISCAVPTNVITSEAFVPRFGREAVNKVIANIGVAERRHVDKGGCASDLAAAAAERLFDDLHTDRSTIDAIIFATQTPDYLVPATSRILQDRLKLPRHLMALDINLGCSGFTDGLILGHSLLKGLALRNVLLLVGDTASKMISHEDQSTALLFGDAVSATLLEASDAPFFYVMGGDGSGASTLIQKFGYRQGLGTRPLDTTQTDIAQAAPPYSDQKHSDFTIQMDSLRVFGFTIECVPKMVKEIFEQTGWTQATTDFFIFHQANTFMLKKLAQLSKIPMEKLPIGMEKFGNTAGASIPLTLVTQLFDRLQESTRLALFGFGIGLAWSAVALEWKDGILCPLVEIDC